MSLFLRVAEWCLLELGRTEEAVVVASEDFFGAGRELVHELTFA